MDSEQASGGSLDTTSDPDAQVMAEGEKPKQTSQLVKFLDLNKFKVEKCRNLTNGKQHNHKHCRYYHTIKDKRRLLDYSKLNSDNLQNLYTPDLCDNYETESCPSQENCELSHNRVESVYHPEKYKTKYCTKYPKNLSKCEYGDYCSFAHSTKELKTRLIH